LNEARAALAGLETDAHALADRLPDLTVEAMRVSTTIAHGIHGRRRAGPGETFWQFRQHQAGDAATMIDWRRSASSDHYYVREREWEAAHTIWLWSDLSPSMRYKSHLSQVTKRDRAVVLALAAAETLVRGGERVGLLGLGRPTASRKAATKLAETIATNLSGEVLSASLPPQERVARFSAVILVSDFLDPVPAIADRMAAIAAGGATGHLLQVLDPAEETLPYTGRTEFLGLEGSDRWLTDRAETLRPLYQQKLAEHRAGVTEAARRLGWSLLVHHTDRPAAEPLLALAMRLQSKGGDYRLAQTAGGAP
jgi:uncharacterized protein (DUF58 family)